jgi:hypothetical protein
VTGSILLAREWHTAKIRRILFQRIEGS